MLGRIGASDQSQDGNTHCDKHMSAVWLIVKLLLLTEAVL
jgi:hypothetical protein